MGSYHHVTTRVSAALRERVCLPIQRAQRPGNVSEVASNSVRFAVRQTRAKIPATVSEHTREQDERLREELRRVDLEKLKKVIKPLLQPDP